MNEDTVRSEEPVPYGVAGAPVLEGWFTLDEGQPHLLGSRCETCGTYYFPQIRGEAKFCRNPDCEGETFAEVKLSRSGKLWSFTNAMYQPPEPFVAADPHKPYAIAAVELDKEKMVVLGMVTEGVNVEALAVGMDMELVREPLEDGRLTWKWRPAGSAT